MAVPKSTPRDAQVMAAILKDMGVAEYEPRVINQMLEFAYRYITDILDDAKVYSAHANKKNIDAEDVKLAIQCRMDHSFTTPPPRELLVEIVRQKNGQPLPLIKPYSGPRLPPDRYCLSAPNYKLKSVKKHKVPISLPMNHFSSGTQRISLTPLQQNISGKVGSSSVGIPGSTSQTLTVVTKGVSLPTVTIVNKAANITSNTVSTTKPTIRITTSSKPMAAASTLASMSSGQPSAVQQSLTLSQFTTSTNPLKRKLDDDDDYDKP